MKESMLQVNVLLIEDDPISQRIQSYMLSELGCKVVTVESGEMALEKLNDNNDIIFVDVGLSGLSGIAVIEIIRQREMNKQHTPIVVLTSHDSEEVKQSCLTAGANLFLTKPIKKNTIQHILKQYFF